MQIWAKMLPQGHAVGYQRNNPEFLHCCSWFGTTGSEKRDLEQKSNLNKYFESCSSGLIGTYLKAVRGEAGADACSVLLYAALLTPSRWYKWKLAQFLICRDGLCRDAVNTRRMQAVFFACAVHRNKHSRVYIHHLDRCLLVPRTTLRWHF